MKEEGRNIKRHSLEQNRKDREKEREKNGRDSEGGIQIVYNEIRLLREGKMEEE